MAPSIRLYTSAPDSQGSAGVPEAMTQATRTHSMLCACNQLKLAAQRDLAATLGRLRDAVPHTNSEGNVFCCQQPWHLPWNLLPALIVLATPSTCWPPHALKC